MKGGEKGYILFKLIVTSYFAQTLKRIVKDNNTLSLNGFMFNCRFESEVLYDCHLPVNIFIYYYYNHKGTFFRPNLKKYFVQKCFIA